MIKIFDFCSSVSFLRNAHFPIRSLNTNEKKIHHNRGSYAVSTTTIINVSFCTFSFSKFFFFLSFVVCVFLRYCTRVLILLATACYHFLMSLCHHCPCCLLWWCNFLVSFFFCLFLSACCSSCMCVCVLFVFCISLLTYTRVFD